MSYWLPSATYLSNRLPSYIITFQSAQEWLNQTLACVTYRSTNILLKTQLLNLMVDLISRGRTQCFSIKARHIGKVLQKLKIMDKAI